MDKAQRAALLRERFKAKGGFAYQPKPNFKPAYKRPEPRGWFNWPINFEAFGTVVKENRAKWIEKPNSVPSSVLRIKRKKRPNPLVEIAKKSGKKRQSEYAHADDYLRRRTKDIK